MSDKVTDPESALPREIVLGALVFRSRVAGAHRHVEVRGIGQPGSRPLLGTIAMTDAEWGDLFATAQRAAWAKQVGDFVRDQHAEEPASSGATIIGMLEAIAEIG